jgi:hypothetical protein
MTRTALKILLTSLISTVPFLHAIAQTSPSINVEKVEIYDILPLKVMYQAMGIGTEKYNSVLQVSNNEVQLQRFQDSQLITVASMPLDRKVLEKLLKGVLKDYFKGTVIYSNPNMRDGGRVRLITPIGDITEYGVISFAKESQEQWPQSILSLAPLFHQFNSWVSELQAIEKKEKGFLDFNH